MEALMVTVFIIGYLFIALEHNIKINKAAPSLITGVLCWAIYIMMTPKTPHFIVHELYEYLGEVSGVLFFLLGAMTIVELIDAHEGFEVITGRITTKKQVVLLWVICWLTFFLSAALDNLTTTIVMISILRKLVKNPEKRMFFVGMVVIAANAGGAWSPIGDVTTTMLWIGGQVTAGNIVTSIFIPSVVCMIIPLAIATVSLNGGFKSPEEQPKEEGPTVQSVTFGSKGISLKPADLKMVSKREQYAILILGVGALLFVPIFKTITHLPPFMGILLGLGVLWLATEIMHKDKNDEAKDPVSVIGVLRRVDVPSVLFFFGILIAISSLQTTGILKSVAESLDEHLGNTYLIGLALGLFSAVVDNVPLVAAAMGMYDIIQFPVDHMLWEFIAYCAGTGGSALIIGSAAGVAAMGMEKIPFGWYVKKISLLALLGYFAGAFTYILMQG